MKKTCKISSNIQNKKFMQKGKIILKMLLLEKIMNRLENPIRKKSDP